MRRQSKVRQRRQGKKKVKTIPFLRFVIVVLVIILIILAFFIGRASIRIPFFPDTGTENLALTRVIRATSSLNTTNSAAQAIDGNQNTHWESNHTFPASLTVYLDRPYILDKVVVKLPASWGIKREKIELLGSHDNITFTKIVAPTTYSISSTATITFNPVVYRYVRLEVSSNSQTNSAQIAEFEIYGTEPRIPWDIQSIDVMKSSKDVVCSPPSTTTIDAMNDRIISLSANFIAISTPYDNPGCGSAIDLTNAWIASARARNLRVWHRHMGLSFEGIYDKQKTKDLTAYTQQIVDYINNNADQFKDGDIFTPTPEPDSAGIYGVTYCSVICQFSSADEYNTWIQTTQFAVKEAFSRIGKNIKVGYYGHSGFIVWGENNPDWNGRGFLTQKTVDAMDGVIAMDTYPETYTGGTMTKSLDGAHARWPNARLVIGEWGSVTSKTDEGRIARVIEAMGAAERAYMDGLNYWHLGPGGDEGILDGNLNPLPAYQTIKDFYTGLR